MADKLTFLGRDIRKKSTDTERQLWNHLMAKQFEGLKFKRRQPVGKYIG
jgi:very-short-patch-repair endonuclease